MAWDSLKVFLPANAERATNLKKRIQQYPCRDDMSVSAYLDDQLKLYVKLCNLDPKRLQDKEFYEIVMDLLPNNNHWLNRLVSIQGRIDRWIKDHAGSAPNSMLVINWIKDEDWQMNKD